MPSDPKPPRRRHHEEPLLNRSLVRGVEILRAFRPGADLLGNGEIAERTALSAATVSRLTTTLVEAGLLEHDRGRRAYRLAAPVLSLSHAMRAGSPVMRAVAPLMHALAEELRINVGLATADRDEMVYLESFRYHRKVALRTVVAGQRVPMELTSLGRAYLAVVEETRRHELLAHFEQRRASEWPRLRADIDEARADVGRSGYCVASWQPEVTALATPLVLPGQPGRPVYVLNVSVTGKASASVVAEQLGGPLLSLRDRCLAAMQQDDL